jgi:hypothetical protein
MRYVLTILCLVLAGCQIGPAERDETAPHYSPDIY